MIKKITIDQLIPGMFVHQILEQKGSLSVKSQGRVTSNDLVNTLKKQGVKTLAIDTEKAFKIGDSASSSIVKDYLSSPNETAKPHLVPLEKELTRASKLHEQGKAIQKLLLENVQKEILQK